MIGISAPLLGGWTIAALTTRTDLFMGPFFWVFAYLLVIGTGLVVWGVMTAPIGPHPPRSFHMVLLEELALGIASFLAFSAFI